MANTVHKVYVRLLTILSERDVSSWLEIEEQHVLGKPIRSSMNIYGTIISLVRLILVRKNKDIKGINIGGEKYKI